MGYDLNRIARRVGEICRMGEREVFSKGRQKHKVEARSLLCYWAVRELGMSQTDLAKPLGMSVPGIGLAVQRGEALARDNQYKLTG